MPIDDKSPFVLNVPPTEPHAIPVAGKSATNEISFIVTQVIQVPREILLPDVKEPKLVILKYEFDMYSLMRGMPLGYIGPLHNAITESTGLHARNLCDFFCGFAQQGDIRLQQIFDKRNEPDLSKLIKHLRKADNSTRDGVDPRQSFNKLIAHMTVEREKNASGYSYQQEFAAIDPFLFRIRDEVVRPYLQNKFPQNVGAATDNEQADLDQH